MKVSCVGCGVLCVVSHSFTPPLYLSEGATTSRDAFCISSSKNRLKHPMVSLHVEGLSRWGPWAGRPATQWAQLTLAFFGWVELWAHLSLARGMAFVMSVSCSSGPFNPCYDTCHALICWNIVPWIMPHHYVAKLAKNHLHTF